MAKKTRRIASARKHPGASTHLIVRGARVHNLKNIDLDFPRNRLIVVTGVSGSGKSSLAFDTIYAEGQRRYAESLSSYARQFLERMDKPDVDLIQGISPAMAIEQRTTTRNPRSTVGTTTEVYDYLRLLFARIGKTHCHNCAREVTRDSVETVRSSLQNMLAKNESDESLRLYITFPLHIHGKESLSDALTNLKKEGFFRVVMDGNIVDLNETSVPRATDPHAVEVLVDRIVFREGEENHRLADSIETAFASGSGKATVIVGERRTVLRFNRNFVCPDCGITYEEPEPALFSFNSPVGACPDCQGFGRAVGFDMDLIVPDKRKSLRDGAIQPWSTPKFTKFNEELLRIAAKAGIRTSIPFEELTQDEIEKIIDGVDGYGGINGFFRMVEKKTYKIYYRVLLSKYRGYTTCQTCKGTRLRREARCVTVGTRHIASIAAMTIAEADQFVRDLALDTYEQEIARRIRMELQKRLSYLTNVGIGYLTLDRLSSTLSGGESQRINLATSLGSSLVGALYVLDEPSIGLHPRDNGRLIAILKALRDNGNTVLVVEHDEDMMKAADILVDMGPGAGAQGGEVVCIGTPREVEQHLESLTGQYLSGRKSVSRTSSRREGQGRSILIEGASSNNLKDLTVRVPLNVLVCVTGVSGSGKSSLVHDVLYGGLRRLKGDFAGPAGSFRRIAGEQHISGVELVDQSPIGRTPRSNPVTYIQVFDLIRTLLASTQMAKVRGFKPGHFSFNVPGGRCEECEGGGVVKVEMQFLADLFLLCDSCKGRRYKEEVLQVRYRGKNVHDVLNMTVAEAIQFFGVDGPGRRIAERLNVLDAVGLGYCKLGQAATSLSGGEAQRIKLAAHLGAASSGQHTLFLFDEPTTGLHADDIAKLVKCLNSLIDGGHSVVVIEHNLDVIKCADYVIDLGPEAGDGGGRIVAEGTPEQVAQVPDSHTGRFLSQIL